MPTKKRAAPAKKQPAPKKKPKAAAAAPNKQPKSWRSVTVGVCGLQGNRPTMEDAHGAEPAFVTSYAHTCTPQQSHPCDLRGCV